MDSINMINRTLVRVAVLGMIGFALLAAGCSDTPEPGSGNDRQTKKAKAGSVVVNTVCPIMGGQVDPDKVQEDLTRQWKNRKIGFCCAGCPKAWDKLSDAEKEQKLNEVLGGTAHTPGQ